MVGKKGKIGRRVERKVRGTEGEKGPAPRMVASIILGISWNAVESALYSIVSGCQNFLSSGKGILSGGLG